MKKALRKIIGELEAHPEQFITIRVRAGLIDMTLWRVRPDGIMPEEQAGTFVFEPVDEGGESHALELFALRLKRHNNAAGTKAADTDDIPF